MRTFENAGEFERAVEQLIGPALADAGLRAQLASSVEKAEVELRKEADGASGEGLNLRLGRFVLRDEDVPVIETIGIATTAALALLVPGVIVAGAIITAVSGFAGLVWKGWRNGAMLSPDEIAVLGLLQIHGPLELEELHRLGTARDPPLSPETVDRALASLREVEMRDGDLVSFIRDDESGLLRARAA